MRKRNEKKREFRSNWLAQALTAAENGIVDRLNIAWNSVNDVVADSDVFVIGQNGVVQSRHENFSSQEPADSDFDWSCLDPSSGELQPLRAKRKRQQLSSIIHHIESLMQRMGNIRPRVVDFGAGSGHLGLLVAARNPHCFVTLVERKAYSIRVAKERILSSGLVNVSIYHDDASALVRDTGSFDIGVSMHSCGQLTDVALQLCVEARAGFVITPCCFGQISKPPPSFIPDDFLVGSSGSTVSHEQKAPPVPITTFRSLSGISADMFCAITSGADYTTCFEDISDEELLASDSVAKRSYLLAKRCMRVVDFDRAIGMLASAGCAYEFYLSTLKPITCSPKNDLIVGTYIGSLDGKRDGCRSLLLEEGDFVAMVREQTRSFPGPCCLDLTVHNVYRFSGYSSFSFTLNEIKRTLPDWLCKRVEACCARHHVEDAFSIRRELVNFKKLCLHLYHRAQNTDNALRRYSSLFFCDIVNTPTDSPEHERYSELCGATMLCRGYLRVLLDMRQLCKLIASIPRHEETDCTGFATELLNLPQSLGAHQLMRNAFEWMSPSLEGDVIALDAVTADMTSKHNHSQLDGCEEFTDLLEDIGRICADDCEVTDETLPLHYQSYIRQCLVSRGVFKAIRIRSYLRRLLSSVSEVRRGSREALAMFTPSEHCRYECLRATKRPQSIKDRIHGDMHGNILQGMLPALESCEWALSALMQCRSGQTPLFLASDASITSIPIISLGHLPAEGLLGESPLQGKCDLMTGLFCLPVTVQHVLATTQSDYQKLLSSSHWTWPPPTIRQGNGRYMKVKASKRCYTCGEAFAKIWLRSSVVAGDVYVCMQCERDCRAHSMCPWSLTRADCNGKVAKTKCPGEVAWCSHLQRCMVCERGDSQTTDCSVLSAGDGCMQCLFLRGNSELVWSVCNKLLEKPSASKLKYLFLDFDGTLTTTFRGRSPLEPSKYEHVVDGYMRELCINQNLSVHIITRNSHVADIEAFMQLEGCCTPERPISVHHVVKKSGRDKWDVIREVIAAAEGGRDELDCIDRTEPLALFVDDTLDELVNVGRAHGEDPNSMIYKVVLRLHYVVA